MLDKIISALQNGTNEVALNALEQLRSQGRLQDGSLQGVDLTEANLQNADFTNADLQAVDFNKANLGSAKFAGANLQGANFWDANGNISIKYDRDTILPNNLPLLIPSSLSRFTNKNHPDFWQPKPVEDVFTELKTQVIPAEAEDQTDTHIKLPSQDASPYISPDSSLTNSQVLVQVANLVFIIIIFALAFALAFAFLTQLIVHLTRINEQSVQTSLQISLPFLAGGILLVGFRYRSSLLHLLTKRWLLYFNLCILSLLVIFYILLSPPNQTSLPSLADMPSNTPQSTLVSSTPTSTDTTPETPTQLPTMSPDQNMIFVQTNGVREDNGFSALSYNATFSRIAENHLRYLINFGSNVTNLSALELVTQGTKDVQDWLTEADCHLDGSLEPPVVSVVVPQTFTGIRPETFIDYWSKNPTHIISSTYVQDGGLSLPFKNPSYRNVGIAYRELANRTRYFVIIFGDNYNC